VLQPCHRFAQGVVGDSSRDFEASDTQTRQMISIACASPVCWVYEAFGDTFDVRSVSLSLSAQSGRDGLRC
jgi:protein involved in ribonucleotide reduction